MHKNTFFKKCSEMGRQVLEMGCSKPKIELQRLLLMVVIDG